MLRTLLLAIVCSAVVGCWDGDERSEPPAESVQTPEAETDPATDPTDTGTQLPTEPAAVPVALVAMRPQALRRCRRFPDLAEVCPRLVPEGRFGPGSGAYQASSRSEYPRAAAWTFSLQQGGEHPGSPALDRPPTTVHVVVTAAAPFPTALPRRATLRDGLMEERRRRPLFLGRVTWGGHEGVLVLAPPFPQGGLQGNHLIFSWGEGSKAVSLHGWEPFEEVPTVLRAIVESIPASS